MKQNLPTQDEINVFLDILRASGVTNMFGAGSYIQDQFGIGKAEARQFLSEWMRTFGERMQRGETVA